jgi:hypothetical protein
MVTTKASAYAFGYSYTVFTTGVFQKNIGDVAGLTTKVSPDGTEMLYSRSGGESFNLHIKNLKTGTDVNTGLRALPEKCAWNKDSTKAYCGAGLDTPQNAYPDVWYQGAEHFNDAFWEVTASTGAIKKINTGENENIDAVSPMLSQDGEFLFFINKNDTSLWSLHILPPPVVLPTPTLPAAR